VRHEEFWQQLEALPVDAPLPADLPPCFYFHLHSYLQSGRFADRLQPWIKAFGRDRCVNLTDKHTHNVAAMWWPHCYADGIITVLNSV